MSPTYAAEIRTPRAAWGSTACCASAQACCSGILNGIDTRSGIPRPIRTSPAASTPSALNARAANKAALQQRLGLEPRAGRAAARRRQPPVLAEGARPAARRLPALAGATARNWRCSAAASRRSSSGFRGAAAPSRAGSAAVIGYDEALAHLIQAGVDALLVPSRFEPCGLTQLCALRYGAVPVVARVGGLADTVIDANDMAWPGAWDRLPVRPGQPRKCWKPRSAAPPVSIATPAWQRLQANGMASDVSWRRPAQQYAALYAEIAPAAAKPAATATTAATCPAGPAAPVTISSLTAGEELPATARSASADAIRLAVQTATAATAVELSKSTEPHMISTIETNAVQRPATGHFGVAQEGAALPTAELRRELRTVDLRRARGLSRDKTLVIGGDGRYYNREVIQTVVRMAAAKASEPCWSARAASFPPRLLRTSSARKAFGGIVLSASHNPGGPDGDFGIKYNVGNGGPAPEKMTEAIYAKTKTINSYRIADLPPIDVDRAGMTSRSPTWRSRSSIRSPNMPS